MYYGVLSFSLRDVHSDADTEDELAASVAVVPGDAPLLGICEESCFRGTRSFGRDIGLKMTYCLLIHVYGLVRSGFAWLSAVDDTPVESARRARL